MTYRAPRWLPGAHAQTIWPATVAPRARVAYRRERWTTPDGDFIDVDFALPPAEADRPAAEAGLPSAGAGRPSAEAGRPAAGDDDRPLVVLFHGLEGDSRSHYALAMMSQALRRGWRGAVAHFRGCGGELNLGPRAYHSGDSDEIDWILRRFAGEHGRRAPLFAIGVSLGANALAKWLGERGSDARFVTAAAAVCAPQDLLAGAQSLSRGFNQIYTRNFLKTLKRKSLDKLAQHPGLFDRQRMLASRSFFDFDDAVTAPMHGFRDCYDYWEKSSSRRFLRGIEVPTLMINARNDPFLPADALATLAEVAPSVTLDYPQQGGHVGFATGPFPGRFEWIPSRVLGFLADHLASPAGTEPPDG